MQTFYFRPTLFFWPDKYFQLMMLLILNPEIQYQYKMENQ